MVASIDERIARDALRECRSFAGPDDLSMRLVAAALRPRQSKRGETIIHADDAGDALFIGASGRVKLPADDGSEPAILTTIGPGGFVGERALLDGARTQRLPWPWTPSRRRSYDVVHPTASSTPNQRRAGR